MEQTGRRELFLLVVEEDPSYAELIRKSLAQNSHYSFRIDQASRIEDAFEKIQKNHYHLVLVEQELRGGHGIDLLKHLQESKMSLPFILLTDIRDDKLARKAIKYGASELIVKSESEFHELASKLEMSFEKYSNHSSAFTRPDILNRVAHPSRLSLGTGQPQRLPKEDDIQYRDDLTGIYNHRYFHERFVREFSSATRYNYPISCLFVDLDNFKEVNEKYGHASGDRVLKEMASLLLDTSRLSDIIARYGGKEFAVLLPHADYFRAMRVAERLREIIEGNVFKSRKSGFSLTASIGVASFPEDPMDKRFELLSFAAQAVKRSKAAGHNRVTAYRDIIKTQKIDLPELKMSEDRIEAFQNRIEAISEVARRACVDASRTLMSALESKDKVTAGHSGNSAKYAKETAKVMGMSEDECETIRLAALLHDVGKLCIPDYILLKEGKLTHEEYEVMKQHPYLGYKMLKPIKFLQEESTIVLHHHEWFNGRGYPCGLKGNDIPLGARVVAVIDAYDTMYQTAHRYRSVSSVKDSVGELIQCAGVQFDPVVVKAFIEVLLREGSLSSLDYDAAKLEAKIRDTTKTR